MVIVSLVCVDARAAGGGVVGSVRVAMVVEVGVSASASECLSERGCMTSVMGNGCRNPRNVDSVVSNHNYFEPAVVLTGEFGEVSECTSGPR